jgi:predicted RNase H-like HicB family nuclease
MKEAIEFHLEGLKENHLPIPESSTITCQIEVTCA